MNKSVLFIIMILSILCLAGCNIISPSQDSIVSESDAGITATDSTSPGDLLSSDATEVTVSAEVSDIDESSQIEPSYYGDASSVQDYKPSFEEQIRSVIDESYMWEMYMPEGESGSMITFTDLDLDGYVELLVARNEGDVLTTTFEFYEYDPSSSQKYSFIVSYDRSMANTPDIMADHLDAYYNDDRIYYGVTDTALSGTAGRIQIKYLMSFHKDFLMFEPVAQGMFHVDEGGDLGNYFDIRDNQITRSEYDRITDTTACGQMGLTKTSVSLSWFRAEDVTTQDAAQLAGTVAHIIRQ